MAVVALLLSAGGPLEGAGRGESGPTFPARVELVRPRGDLDRLNLLGVNIDGVFDDWARVYLTDEELGKLRAHGFVVTVLQDDAPARARELAASGGFVPKSVDGTVPAAYHTYETLTSDLTQIAAEAMGINTTRYKVMAFVISAALAGIAGGLSGQLFANPLNPQNLNFVKSIEVIVMIVLGGIGSITGAVLGASILTVLPEALRAFDQQFPGLRMVIYALLLILLMIFRPQGLLGRREFSWAWLRPMKRRPVLE